MFISRAAARRRLFILRVERELIRNMQAHFDRLFVNALLYGTSHPEALIDYQPNGDDDVRKA
jgi:hypothetical protein